jgi:PAS domain S-box-containing protein
VCVSSLHEIYGLFGLVLRFVPFRRLAPAPTAYDRPVEPEALHHLPLAVGVVDAAGAIRYVNRAAERLYRFRAEDVIGKSALALGVAPSDTAAAADLLSRLQLGETWRGRFPLRRADGSRVPAWVSVASMPVADDPDAEPWLVVTAIEDVDLFEGGDTVQRAAEDRAEDANLLLQGLLDSVPVGLAFFDPSGRFVRVNANLAKVNGVPAEAHVGRPIGELLAGLPPHVEDDITEVFATGRTIDQREVVWAPPSSPDDERVWLVSYFPVSRAGEVRWVGAIAVEVTEWRRGELERARLFDAERTARRAAELAAERLARLQVVTARLAEAADRERVAEIVVHHGTEGVGASVGALCLLDGDVLELRASTGLREETRVAYERIPLDADIPVAEVMRTGELLLIGSLDELVDRYPGLAGETKNRAFATVPMVVDGRGLGAIAFSWEEERSFDEGERHFLLALGRQAAQALERARLYDAERRARAAAEAAGERMRFLAEASRVLSSSFDDEQTLSAMASMAVPAIADACLIHLLDRDDLRLVVAAHHDRGDGRRLAAVTAHPRRQGEPRLLGRAAMRGESVVLDALPDDLLVRVAENEEQLGVLRSLDLRSAIVVPLQVQDRILGVLSVAFDGSSGRRFTTDDLPFVEDLAGRAAVAIENSRSHRARTEVARTLQASLLPPHLPRIAGLELASRYQSIGDVEVGGDFYDVFPAGEGRWGVVIGDVCGKGVGAASLTALARYTVRAGAIGDSPSGVLRLLNRAILDAEVGERFCTIAHAMVEPGRASSGGARIVLACGGHPLPLLLSAEGSVRPVGAPGTAVGLFDDVVLSEVVVELAPGDALALYTDGFTEARSPSGEFDPGLLERALASAAGGSAERIADVVERAVGAFDAGRQRDDRALLVLRVPASG